MIQHRLLSKYNYPKAEIENLIENYRTGNIRPEDNIIKAKLEYPSDSDFKSLPPKDSLGYQELYEAGINAIESGQLGMVILNGGMATRFGGVVKGIVEVFDGMSFLELKVKSALKISQNIKFYIMNSFSTDQKTRQHLEEKNYFNVPDKINIFNQFIAPRITAGGEYFKPDVEEKAFYGPGHGDFPLAFKKSGLLNSFIKDGGKYIFFSNVDNLGAKIDPAILGFHISKNIELTAEIAPKSPGDEGGAPAVVNGKLQLVEGFCFSNDFDQSKIPVFNCSTYWVNTESLENKFQLPWYVVKKKVDGEDVIQFEHLAGDLTKFLETSFLKVPRNERFFPIKRPEDLEKNKEDLKKLLGYKS
jgi:UTP--glucose-1-phosphate uridylyltransferase